MRGSKRRTRTPASRPNTWSPSSASRPIYGRITGKYRVLDALATLAFDYPPRGDFFRGELAQFIALAREEAVDPLTALGSYAGAMGAGQFMPSSYRAYAVDGGNDRQRDLFADWDDIIASVANYFKEHGWVADGPVLAEAVLQPDAPVAADPANLALNETVAGLKCQGVASIRNQDAMLRVLLVPAATGVGPSYRVGFKNFEVITRYNRSLRTPWRCTTSPDIALAGRASCRTSRAKSRVSRRCAEVTSVLAGRSSSHFATASRSALACARAHTCARTPEHAAPALDCSHGCSSPTPCRAPSREAPAAIRLLTKSSANATSCLPEPMATANAAWPPGTGPAFHARPASDGRAL